MIDQKIAVNILAMTKLMSPHPGKVNTQVSIMSFTTPKLMAESPTVMWLTRLQLSADPHEKHRTVLPDNGVLPLLGGELGI